MQNVCSTLKAISPEQEQDNIVIYNASGEKKAYSLEKHNSNSCLSKETRNLNNELDINDYKILNIGPLNIQYESGISFEINEHPDTQKVASTYIQIDNVNEEKQNYSLNNYGSNSKLNKETISLNDLD